MVDINEFSIRKVITVELITTLCLILVLSLCSLLFGSIDEKILAIKKEIFMFIAGAFTGCVSTAMALYFNRNDRINQILPTKEEGK